MGNFHKCNNQGHQTHKDFKVITRTVRSMDIEHMSIDRSQTGHQTSKPR